MSGSHPNATDATPEGVVGVRWIASAQESEWWECYLPPLVNMIRWAIHSQANFPSRAELRKRLRGAVIAAKFLQAELGDLTFLGVLDRAGGGISAVELIDLNAGLADLGQRAILALNDPPTKHGPTDTASISGMELCALIVGLVWEKRVGKWPGKGRAEAHRSCEALWNAADGPKRSGWGRDDSVGVWRNHLKAAALKRDGYPAAQIIRRRLNELDGDGDANTQRRRTELHSSVLKLLGKVHSPPDQGQQG